MRRPPIRKASSETKPDHSTASQLFDEDAHGRTVAEGNPRPVDLANERPAPAYLRNKGGFAEAHLSHPLTEIRVAPKFANASHRARRIGYLGLAEPVVSPAPR